MRLTSLRVLRLGVPVPATFAHTCVALPSTRSRWTLGFAAGWRPHRPLLLCHIYLRTY